MRVGLPGDGIGPLTIPGDPGALRRAAAAYATAAVDFGTAAGQLHGQLAEVATWQGAGARAHALRAQALAAAHQVAAQTLNFAATTLSTYAGQLEAAQSLARQANSATDQANLTGQQLNQAMTAAAEANQAAAGAQASLQAPVPGQPGQTVSTPPTAASQLTIGAAHQAAQRVTALQQDLQAQQTHASSLAGQAQTMAHAAALTASAAFGEIAQLAGNPALHATAADPFIAYLGTSTPGLAAATIEASYNLGGNPVPGPRAPGGDTKALADLAADPGAGAANTNLAAQYNKSNLVYAAAAQKELSILNHHHITADQLPGWISNLSPVTQAAVLYQLVERIPSGFLPDFLHAVSTVAGVAAGVFTFASLAELGANPVADGSAAAADGIAEGADTEASQELQKALDIVKWNKRAIVFGGLATGADVGENAVTGEWGVPQIGQLAFDSLSFLPGVAALRADFSLADKIQVVDETQAQLETLAPGSEDYTALATKLKALEAGRLSTETLAKILAAKSLSAGAGGITWSAASWGLQPSG